MHKQLYALCFTLVLRAYDTIHNVALMNHVGLCSISDKRVDLCSISKNRLGLCCISENHVRLFSISENVFVCSASLRTSWFVQHL